MQLEETASSKDVPPLSIRGVLELPEFIAQKNKQQMGLTNLRDTLSCVFPVFSCCMHKEVRFLV